MKSRTALSLLALAALAASCTDPATYLPPDQAGGPAGVLEGTVTYAGLLPCTQSQHILGAALVEVFDVRLLPPPEGLGTSAASLAVVPGDVLFDGVRNQLTFNNDGSRWCPPAAAKPVVVSGSWGAGPVSAAQYEVRAFYDYDGNFDPVLSVYKVPTKGDVGGGAIDNAAEVLQGKPPVYRKIDVGRLPDGTYKMPDLGVLVSGISVTLGLPLPLQPPIFYESKAIYSTKVCKGDTAVADTATHPADATMPSDYTLPNFSAIDPTATEDSLIRVGVTAGLPSAEIDTAAGAPFDFPVKSPKPFFQVNWQDVNGDGVRGDGVDKVGHVGEDHVPDSTLIPSLFPLAIFSKLADKTDAAGKTVPDLLTAQASPAVILQGLTIYKTLYDTAFSLPSLSDQVEQLSVGVRPAVLCLDPAHFDWPAFLVVSHLEDCGGNNAVISNEGATKAALKRQFGHDVEIVEACLPEGEYALNLIYETGQAWTLPNEAGVCQAAEAYDATNAPDTCGDPATDAHRPLIHSQGKALTIGAPTDASYCETKRKAALDALKAAHPDAFDVLQSCFPASK
jgi:hypothetical protein